MDIRSDRQKGLSYVELGRKYHMDPRTAKRYAESPQKPEYTLSEPKPTKMDPYKQIVDEWLEEAPYSALRILEKLREIGFNGGYSIVKAYVSSRKMDLNEKATVRFETMPGKQGQMDWGFFEDHLVYEDGKWKKLYCFLMILGYSRMRYIEFVTDMSTNTLIRCHQNAFRYFGGYPEEILYDNMKQVVIKRLLKQEDSTLNRQFEDFAGFYGFKPILCRPYRGQTKGNVCWMRLSLMKSLLLLFVHNLFTHSITLTPAHGNQFCPQRGKVVEWGHEKHKGVLRGSRNDKRI